MKRSTWLMGGLIALVSMVVALCLAEAAIRLLAPQPTGITDQDRYGLALHYAGITRYLPQYGHSVTFNRAGMRDREHSLEKPDTVYRILLLGDSFMEAMQVSFESSMPSLLERALPRLEGKRVEVVSAGVSGWGTDDELRYLLRYGLKYNPDLVVVAMTLHNDISDNLRQTWHTLQNGELVEHSVAPMSYWKHRKTRVKAFIATRFQLYQLWRKVRHGGEIRRVGRALNEHVLSLFREPTPESTAYGFELTDRLLMALRDTARSSGAPVTMVLLPIVHQLSDSSFLQFVNNAKVPPAEMSLYKPQRTISAIAARLDIPVIDLLPRFREWTASSNQRLYLQRDGHWNEAGHRLAAEIVVQGILGSGVVR